MTLRTGLQLAHHLGDADAAIIRVEGRAEVEVVIEEKSISPTTV